LIRRPRAGGDLYGVTECALLEMLQGFKNTGVASAACIPVFAGTTMSGDYA
jgi:hypothetical protein